ncbi:protein FAR1-RELATED SEQUENCE 5-like [Silene latifolia]|uniref:protein FAR1-RELATED SEQUENCE 5-like n=1 Tax=Silene latifolia TaxID=37657 RepID=UPI003D7780D1
MGSRSSSNVITNDITNEGQMVEVIASQSISEISALNIDVPEIVQEEAEVIEDAEEEEEEKEEASGSSNMNRIFGFPTHLKPVIGMVFDTLELCIAFYEAYAKECGFVTRKGSQKNKQGVTTHKTCLCNKAGECEAKGKKHRRQRTRVGCLAKIKFKRIANGQYQIYGFVEGHNHMPATPLTMVHLTQTRELNIVHKKMIVDNSKVNKGPVMTYRMFKEYVRGYQNVGASLEDFKNFSRDIKKFLSEGDAQMLIEHFMKIKRMCPSFYFDFEVDEKGRLSHVFWADPISIKNYLLFGDMTSFDTTFRKNKYRMIFAPFTGVDHHKRCVTFGAGLLINESKESFAWLFTKFLEAMGGRYPVCIITDEDLGIEGGLKKVFKDKVQHRYCMWHILKKLPEKVGLLYVEKRVLKEINSCVWGEDVEPAEFEERWTSIVEAHGLSDNEWLQKNVKDRERKKDYKVGYKTAEVKLVCNCKKFERHGILCRHILCVLKDYGFEKIPSEYLLNRWSKLATCQPIFNSDGQLLADCRSVDAQKNKLTELWSEMFTCVSLVEQSPVNCDELLTILREFKERVLAETTSSVADDGGNSSIGKKRDKNAEIGMLLGTSVPSEITILPPRQCKNKGSGKRMISQRERAGEVNKKPLRRCKACGQMANHDSRNCDRPKDH